MPPGPDPDAAPGDGTPHRPFRRRLLVNTASVGAANAWAMVTAVISLPLVLRGLGATAFGLWALLQTFSAVGGWFSLLDLGLTTAATREVAGRHALDDARGVATAIGSTLAMLVALGAGSALLLALVGPALFTHLFGVPASLEQAMHVAIVAFSAQVLLDLVCGGLQSVLDGFQRVDLSRSVDVVRRTLVAAATSVVALVTEDLGAVAIASLVAVAVATVVAAAIVARVARGHAPRFERATARSLLAYGKTVAVLRPLGVIRRSIDRFIVGAVLGPAAVSLVEVATQLQNGADAVLSASSYSVVPSAARLHAHGAVDKLRELTDAGTRYVLLATWSVAALIAVLAAPAIDIWVGAQYQEAAVLAALGVLAVAITAPTQVGSNLLLGTGKARTLLGVAALELAVNVPLSLFLVHQVGVAGAFQASVVAALIGLPLLVAAVTVDLDLSPRSLVRSSMLPALPAPLAAGIAAGAVVALPLGSWPTVLLGGVLGSAAAVAAIVAFGLDDRERSALGRRARSALRRSDAST